MSDRIECKNVSNGNPPCETKPLYRIDKGEYQIEGREWIERGEFLKWYREELDRLGLLPVDWYSGNKAKVMI